jgi:hypothetical protein
MMLIAFRHVGFSHRTARVICHEMHLGLSIVTTSAPSISRIGDPATSSATPLLRKLLDKYATLCIDPYYIDLDPFSEFLAEAVILACLYPWTKSLQ